MREILFEQLDWLDLHHTEHGGVAGCIDCDRYAIVKLFLMRPFEERRLEVRHNAAA